VPGGGFMEGGFGEVWGFGKEADMVKVGLV
jgi:hypothetical protein